MVLDRTGCEGPPFSQGALFDFRERLIRTDLDRRLLEHTAEVARTTGEFDWKKLPKTLRVAIDSSPRAPGGTEVSLDGPRTIKRTGENVGNKDLKPSP